MRIYASRNRKRAGKIAKSKGEFFESIVSNRFFANGFYPIRIPDGCRQVRGPNGLALIRVTSPFDFVLVGDACCIFLDAKATESNRFIHSKINQQQLRHLKECQTFHPAGYLVWFEKLDQVVFYSADVLDKIKKRQGLGPIDGLMLGSLRGFDPRKIIESFYAGKAKVTVYSDDVAVDIKKSPVIGETGLPQD